MQNLCEAFIFSLDDACDNMPKSLHIRNTQQEDNLKLRGPEGQRSTGVKNKQK